MDKLDKIVESYPVELKFLLVCCGSMRWKAEKLLPEVDWELFIKWMRRHRVAPVVYTYIKENSKGFPDYVIKKIENLKKKINRHSLILTSELITVGKLFDENKIPWYTVKGPALSQYLYGDIFCRDYRDIDIVVPNDQATIAISLLKAKGYWALLKLDTKDLLNVNHNIELKNENIDSKVELHWKLFANDALSDLFSFRETRIVKSVIQGNKINTPVQSMNNHYIIIHAALHQWSELQWLIDCNAVLNRSDISETTAFFKKKRILPVIKTFNTVYSHLFRPDTVAPSDRGMMAIDCLRSVCLNKKTVWEKIRKTRYLASLSDDPAYKRKLLGLRVKRLINNPAKRLS